MAYKRYVCVLDHQQLEHSTQSGGFVDKRKVTRENFLAGENPIVCGRIMDLYRRTHVFAFVVVFTVAVFIFFLHFVARSSELLRSESQSENHLVIYFLFLLLPKKKRKRKRK